MNTPDHQQPQPQGSIPIGTEEWHQFFAMARDLAQKADFRRRKKQQKPLRAEEQPNINQPFFRDGEEMYGE